MQNGNDSDWRQLLGTIIQDTRVKQRIIDELGVTGVTIGRWVSGENDPRPQNLRQLLNVLPEHRDKLLDLLGDDFTEEIASSVEDPARDIPPQFLTSVLSARANTRKEIRYWTLGNLIIRQALGQLDPERLGMAITFLRCMKTPHNPYIRSLHETVAHGTPAWPGNLEQQGMFLGAESLSGFCVTICRGAENNGIHDPNSMLPANQLEYELSAAAYPILLSGKVAGCLLVSSTQPHYFLSQYRLELIHNYANMLALAFEPEDFYDMKDIRLEVMPPLTEQRPYFSDFRKRVTALVIQERITGPEAEQKVLEELEEVLLQVQREAQAKLLDRV